MEFDEEIREFLIESNENLASLDREIVQLEQNPGDMQLISSAFRTIHTIKGTCGFFGYDVLSSVTHVAENLLTQVRERQRELTPELISLILEATDAVKVLLSKIEQTGSEGVDHTGPLRARLEEAHRSCKSPGGEAPACESERSVPLQAVEPAATCLPASVSPTSTLHSPSGDQDEADRLPANLGEPVQEGFVHLQEKRESADEDVILSRAPSLDLTGPDNSLKEEAGEVAKDASKDGQLSDSTIRVDVGLLNRLMNLVGELVLARNQLMQDTSAQNASLQKTSQRLNLITSELQEGVMKTRMQPIGVVWNKLPRVVRDLASRCGKRIQIEMDGAGTELDKTIIEAIKDPLTHIVRNSCDHGIETPEERLRKNKNPEGLLLLRAYHEGGVVNIEISDDGAGIDPASVKAKALDKGLIRPEQAAQMSTRDALHLIFLPGFSTAAQVTSISGRGVGMDVVKTNIEKIGGNVDVLNRPESGTTIRIKIPLTLAIIPGLVVTLDEHPGRQQTTQGPKWNKEERFIIPQANLLELVRVEGDEVSKRIENVHGTPVFHHRGNLLPLVYLGRVLGRAEGSLARDVVNIVVLQAENRQLGLVVDRICDTQEIVVKPLGRQLKGLSCYVGATIMGDGRPALILDVAGLSRLAGLGVQSRQSNAQTPTVAVGSSQPQMMLLFRAGLFERLAVPLSLVDRLEEISAGKIERAAGRPVLHYRDSILPLVTLDSMLPTANAEGAKSSEHVQIIVFTDGNRRVGLMVDQIIDIVNEAVTVRRTARVKGLLGSALIGGKITDLLDLHAVVQSSGENWLDPSLAGAKERQRILLLDPSVVAREMINEFLDVSGYEVIQASTASEAVPKMRQSSVDLVITATGVPPSGGFELLEAMRDDASLEHIPLLALLDRADQPSCSWASGETFSAQVVRSEREELLRTLGALMHTPTAGVEVSR